MPMKFMFNGWEVMISDPSNEWVKSQEIIISISPEDWQNNRNACHDYFSVGVAEHCCLSIHGHVFFVTRMDKGFLLDRLITGTITRKELTDVEVVPIIDFDKAQSIVANEANGKLQAICHQQRLYDRELQKAQDKHRYCTNELDDQKAKLQMELAALAQATEQNLLQQAKEAIQTAVAHSKTKTKHGFNPIIEEPPSCQEPLPDLNHSTGFMFCGSLYKSRDMASLLVALDKAGIVHRYTKAGSWILKDGTFTEYGPIMVSKWEALVKALEEFREHTWKHRLEDV